jgi:hypothetical protein
MDDVTIALAIHVMAVVLWIGGVAMVTTVLLSAIRRFKSAEERTAFFEKIERRFARQARGTILFAGAHPGRSVDRGRACIAHALLLSIRPASRTSGSVRLSFLRPCGVRNV